MRYTITKFKMESGKFDITYTKKVAEYARAAFFEIV